MYDFKNSFSLAFVHIHRAKYIFPETCFAYPISDQKFTVWRQEIDFEDKKTLNAQQQQQRQQTNIYDGLPKGYAYLH